MARLNEAPIPTESVDVLKRRFIRQNRELAKNNSQQSVRIRCLESEVSRLLAENLDFREEIINLRNELENALDKEKIGGVAELMEVKMHELEKLVQELGLLQKKSAVGESKSKRVDGEQARREPNIGWGRGMVGDMDGQDGRLPTIREDKSFPRRTLGAGEIHNLGNSATSDSPDLGSPPVAHFRDEDPIKFDPQPSTSSDASNDKENSGDLDSMSINLETRRKRRDSNTKLAIRRMSVFHSPPERIEDESFAPGAAKAINQTLPVRAGAKRKLAAREDSVTSEAKAEDFTFSRKPFATTPNEMLTEANEKGENRMKEKRESSSTAVTVLPERRALGEKSINTDPVVSPKKTSTIKVAPLDEKEKPKARKPSSEPAQPPNRDKDAPKPKTTRERRASRAAINVPPPLPISASSPALGETTENLEPKTLGLPPKTPAVELADFFSPATTEASTNRPKDTPPPAELNGGRVARRARGTVNYAEPSLNSKMRRPTKELMDAVGRDGRPLSINAPSNNSKTVVVKQEPLDDDDYERRWTTMPSLPAKGDLLEPGSPSEMRVGTSARTGRTEDAGTGSESSAAVERVSGAPSTSAASAAISALSSASRKSKAHCQQSQPSKDTDTQLGPAASKHSSSTTTASRPSTFTHGESRSVDASQKDHDKKQPNDQCESKGEKRSSLAIFDFTSSSPPPAIAPLSKINGSRGSSRRHSSISSLTKTSSSSNMINANSTSYAPSMEKSRERMAEKSNIERTKAGHEENRSTRPPASSRETRAIDATSTSKSRRNEDGAENGNGTSAEGDEAAAGLRMSTRRRSMML